MKAILEFNLDEAEDIIRHKQCCEASNVISAIDNFRDKLRGMTKYGTLDNKELTETELNIAERISDLFYETIGNIEVKRE